MRIFVIVLSVLTIPLRFFAQTSYTDSISHGGMMREFKVYVPATYSPSNPVPLVFNLHGYTSNMTEQEIYADFRPIADTANFILLHPNGTVDQYGNMHWNAFNTSAVDDIGFLNALLDSVSAQYSIDQERVYSCGMSNGGFMSYVLACTSGDRYTAVASVTGGMTFNRMNSCSPTHPTPVMQIHGTMDGTVPYNGDAFTASVDSLINYWVNLNNTNSTPTINPVPDSDPGDGATADHFVYSGGTNDVTVELFKVYNGGHTWPGAPIAFGTTCQDFDASIEIWKFFQQYVASEITETDMQLRRERMPLIVYPNPSTGEIHLQMDQEGDKLIVVVDATGREVYRRKTSSTDKNIKITAPGAYFISVRTEDVVQTAKHIVR